MMYVFSRIKKGTHIGVYFGSKCVKGKFYGFHKDSTVVIHKKDRVYYINPKKVAAVRI
ncbi:hypothetical protein [Brevibacillus sp. SYSU BS000544]|uniref:hypothetical protein n=1 Tax=Brevibacillus sp. SYSU BS000544 TaxID=3416443 RepID=UPI003CE5BA63